MFYNESGREVLQSEVEGAAEMVAALVRRKREGFSREAQCRVN